MRKVFILLLVIVASIVQHSYCVIMCNVTSKNTHIVNNIFDAENILFTASNRLLVSGGDNVFEVIKINATSFSKIPLFNSTHYFMGLAQFKNIIFVLDNQGFLYQAFDSTTKPFSFTPVFKLQNSSLPNGMGISNDGYIFIADSAYKHVIDGGNIWRLKIASITPDQGAFVTEQVSWLAKPHVMHPNGLKILNDFLYVTDTSKFIAIPIIKNITGMGSMSGPLPGNETIMYQVSLVTGNFFDDFNFVVQNGDTVLAVLANYLRSSLTFLKVKSTTSVEFLFETDALTFEAPSALVQGQEPMFNKNTLVVTNKGIIGSHSGWGNLLSMVTFSCTN